MEIQQSIVSQALYGENGRAALPLSMFTKQSNQGQSGGKNKIDHLGVPLVLAVVNIHMNKPCNHIVEPPIDQLIEYIPSEQEKNALIYGNDTNEYIGNYRPITDHHYQQYEPISDKLYDSLFNTVLEEPIVSEYSPSKKYTRKIQKIKSKKLQ